MKMQKTILLIDDDSAFRFVMANELGRLGFATRSADSGETGLASAHQAEPDVVLLDLQMPGMNGLDTLKALRESHASVEVIMLTGHGSIETAIEAIRAGAFDYVVKPCPLDELEVRIHRAIERQALRQRTSVLERGLTPPDLGSSFVGDSPGFRTMLHLIDRVAPTDASVLITGETGCGKEMVAKLIHTRSLRRTKPFVVVECAALQETLLQSELFGHERGAFTGADRAKPGLFEVANGGTIFLDEIGEVSPTTQVKLLRVLDTSTFRHVGGTSEIRVDVRVLAATNRDLPAMVRQGLFREDLYYRLRTIAVEIPALRDRTDDIRLLASYFVQRFNERFGFQKRISADAVAALGQHPWPGNVRELLHVVEAAMVVCDGPEINRTHLPLAIQQAAAPSIPTNAAAIPTLEALERAHIEAALTAARGHRAQAAATLGISERSLYRKLREYGLLA